MLTLNIKRLVFTLLFIGFFIACKNEEDAPTDAELILGVWKSESFLNYSYNSTVNDTLYRIEVNGPFLQLQFNDGNGVLTKVANDSIRAGEYSLLSRQLQIVINNDTINYDVPRLNPYQLILHSKKNTIESGDTLREVVHIECVR